MNNTLLAILIIYIIILLIWGAKYWMKESYYPGFLRRRYLRNRAYYDAPYYRYPYGPYHPTRVRLLYPW